MKFLTISLLVLAAVLATACGGHAGSVRSGSVALRPLYGTPAQALRVEEQGEAISIAFAPTSANIYAQLELPAGKAVGMFAWSGLDQHDGQPAALAISLPNAHGLELGVARLPAAAPGPVSLMLTLVPASRQISVAPTGPDNIITDLTVVDRGGGQVLLGWTEINKGDLDLNGEVNAADLAAIARNYNRAYSTSDPHKRDLPEYWADGDGNGLVSAADLTTIGQHYKSAVAGYNIRHNGALLPGSFPGKPTVLPTAATQFPGLPRHYSLLTAGLATDSWIVTAVDFGGVQGANSAGNPGTADVTANLTIGPGNLQLLDLNGTNAGGFGGTKFASRIIDPIEIINRATLVPPVGQLGASTVFSGVPRQKTLLVNFTYLPSADLGTGAPRGASTVRSASVLAGEYVNTAVPFTLPAGSGSAQVDAMINLTPNPAGGYFVDLTAMVSAAGQPTTTTTTRLDYHAAQLNRDTNSNGNFGDEATFLDNDLDCVSNALVASQQDDSEYDSATRGEGKLTATVSAIDQAQGTLTLSNMTLVGGDISLPPPPLTMHFNEQTNYGPGLTASAILPGNVLEVEFYRLTDPAGQLPDVFWIKSLSLEGGDAGAFLEASDNRTLEIRVRWNKVPGYSGFVVERYSPREPNGIYELDWSHTYSAADTDQYDDTAVVVGTVYKYVYFGDNGTLVELSSDTGVALPQ